jgi:transposase
VDKVSLEVLLGRGLSLEEIGRRFDRHPSTVAYWMRKYRLVAANADKHAPRGGLDFERLQPLVEAGMTIAEIAAEVERSKATVRHWLGRHGLRTKNTRGRRPAELGARAKEAGLLAVNMRCIRHGETEFVLEGRGHYRCKRCRSESVARHRRKVKETLVAEAGGCCVVCGYDRCLTALAFHHLDPGDKRLAISQNGVTLSLDTIRAEAQKCVLVCANCHAEIESGAASLPDTVARAAIRLNE